MIRRPFHVYDEVESTQLTAFALAGAGAPSGSVILAAMQRRGRGRAGRSWIATPGDALLMSIMLRRPADALPPTWLSMAAGLAVIRAVEDDTLRPALKWPNDVLIDDRKVAGILIESRILGSERIVVIGIGVNVRSDLAELPPGATSLAALGGAVPTVPDLAERTCSALEAIMVRVWQSGSVWLADEVNPLLALRGAACCVLDGDRQERGVVHAVDHDGALLLETDRGLQRLIAGDLTRGPRRVEPS